MHGDKVEMREVERSCYIPASRDLGKCNRER
jgi:hypothetical protein